MKIIFLGLLIIMFIPIHVNLKYNQKLTGYLCYLIWRKSFLTQKQKDKNGLSQNIANSNNEINKKKIILKKKLSSKNKNTDVKTKKINLNKERAKKHNFLKKAKELEQFVSKKMLKSYINLLKCFFCFGVRTKAAVSFKFFVKDMEKTGTLYGTMCAALALISIPKNFNIFITPNFAEQKSRFKFNFRANIYPIGVLFTSLLIVIRLTYDIVRFKIFRQRHIKEAGK
ncbi:MAG: hypothetical protein ACI4PI_02575 [Oscillospiraceae bacterium]